MNTPGSPATAIFSVPSPLAGEGQGEGEVLRMGAFGAHPLSPNPSPARGEGSKTAWQRRQAGGPARHRNPQSGVALLEALIAILIFSLGILSVLAIQAASIRMAAEAQYRTKAILLANRLIGEIWTSGGDFTAIKNKFTGTGTAYAQWLTDAQNPGKGGLIGFMSTVPDDLCGSAGGPTVEITEPTSVDDYGAVATVVVRIRWKTPAMSDTDCPRMHVVTSRISRNPT